jgi:hypothetical protein
VLHCETNRQDHVTAAIAVGDFVAFKFGRGATARTLAGTVTAFRHTKAGQRRASIRTGSGFETEVVRVRLGQIKAKVPHGPNLQ